MNDLITLARSLPYGYSLTVHRVEDRVHIALECSGRFVALADDRDDVPRRLGGYAALDYTSRVPVEVTAIAARAVEAAKLSPRKYLAALAIILLHGRRADHFRDSGLDAWMRWLSIGEVPTPNDEWWSVFCTATGNFGRREQFEAIAHEIDESSAAYAANAALDSLVLAEESTIRQIVVELL